MSDQAVVTTPVVPTTPNAPVTPTEPTVTAPVEQAAPVVQATEEPKSMEDMIGRIAKKATVDAAAFSTQHDPNAVVPGTPDPDIPTDTVPPPTDTPVVDATPPSLVAEIKADEPEGEVVLRARDPKTGQFSDMDQTRTYELSIRDKQTGETKVYNKTLPDLMRMAKDGISMQKSRDELQFYRTKTPEWQQQFQSVQQEAEGLRALAMELLTADESIVVARREAYVAEQSPEKQLARLKAQIAQQEAQRLEALQQHQQQQVLSQHGQALASRIGPVVQEVEGLVGQEAAAGKLALDTAPLMVNGRIPPERFTDLQRYVEGPYREWARAEAAKRSTQQAEITKQQELARQTQQKAQLAARSLGAATRPTGGVAANTPPAPQGKPKNMNDAISRIISRPVAAGA